VAIEWGCRKKRKWLEFCTCYFCFSLSLSIFIFFCHRIFLLWRFLHSIYTTCKMQSMENYYFKYFPIDWLPIHNYVINGKFPSFSRMNGVWKEREKSIKYWQTTSMSNKLKKWGKKALFCLSFKREIDLK
jgi:hypothetical protein